MDENAARTVAKAAVQETFLALGVDISTPAAVLEAQQGFYLLRTVVRMKSYALTVAVGLATSGVLWWAYETVQAAKAAAKAVSGH